MQDANEKLHYRELVGEPLSPQLGFAFPLDHAFELILLGEQMSPVADDKFSVIEKNIYNA